MRGSPRILAAILLSVLVVAPASAEIPGLTWQDPEIVGIVFATP
jgi:hypothetical protein